jgi:hypothetical protein
MKIAYQENNGITVIYPNQDWDINVVARKDVPQGVAYKIVANDVDMAALDFTTPDGYGDPEGYWAEQQSVLD